MNEFRWVLDLYSPEGGSGCWVCRWKEWEEHTETQTGSQFEFHYFVVITGINIRQGAAESDHH